MFRKLAVVMSAVFGLAMIPLDAGAHPDRDRPQYTPGAPGIGDPYFPTDGNGGYDVRHYGLAISYTPDTDALTGTATISATATQNLSQFNLDLKNLTVSSVTVNGRTAQWRTYDNELEVTPARGLDRGRRFTTEIRYSGTPAPDEDPIFGKMGFLPTDDGALVVGQPHVASSWFPVNDHPSDKASYDISIRVPAGLEAVSNGILTDRRTRGGWTTWSWRAKEPMASYLATATIGQFDLHSYRAKGISFLDAIDPDLFTPLATPTTGSNLLNSQIANASYKRLTRTITVPAGGASVTYDITRNTEQDWDFTFVEAHTVGADNWTTLPDSNGHTSSDLGFSCPGWLELHPFLAHYQSFDGTSCAPTGTSGTWSAATGRGDGREQWRVDLGAFAGQQVEVSIAYVSDEVFQQWGVFIDDIVVSTGEGTTSFENDGDPFDGWTVAGPPAGSPGNENDWIIGTQDQVPPPPGVVAQASFARQSEILDFLSDNFGRYPFTAAGGIVDDLEDVGFALENQTRPIYAPEFFSDQISGDSVVVHELTHQWFGDNLSVSAWKDIWLNEGFATYAEWLWSEREGLGTVAEIADSVAAVPAEDGFWQLTIGDPGPVELFAPPVYYRGAMTLYQLRVLIGDDSFNRLLKTWARTNSGSSVTTEKFIALAERISGQDLDAFFQTWLYTATKPDLPQGAFARVAAAATVGVPLALPERSAARR